MQLAIIDWLIIIAFFAVSIGIGVWASRSAGKSFKDYFLAGGKMSWWLLGVSMVATTFAADTPGLVTQLVRQGGVSGNWAWWAFLLTGLLTVFVYAKPVEFWPWLPQRFWFTRCCLASVTFCTARCFTPASVQ